MSPSPAAAQPVGYNTPAVEAWIDQQVPALRTPLTWTRLEGGHSNLTYQVQDAAGQLAVIRRPPMGELLPKAHDMAREWALISALGATKVPVPRALGFCADPSVTGAPFYLMGHVDGHPLYTAADARRWLPEPLRSTLARSVGCAARAPAGRSRPPQWRCCSPPVGPQRGSGSSQAPLNTGLRRARKACPPSAASALSAASPW